MLGRVIISLVLLFLICSLKANPHSTIQNKILNGRRVLQEGQDENSSLDPGNPERPPAQAESNAEQPPEKCRGDGETLPECENYPGITLRTPVLTSSINPKNELAVNLQIRAKNLEKVTVEIDKEGLSEERHQTLTQAMKSLPDAEDIVGRTWDANVFKDGEKVTLLVTVEHTIEGKAYGNKASFLLQFWEPMLTINAAMPSVVEPFSPVEITVDLILGKKDIKWKYDYVVEYRVASESSGGAHTIQSNYGVESIPKITFSFPYPPDSEVFMLDVRVEGREDSFGGKGESAESHIAFNISRKAFTLDFIQEKMATIEIPPKEADLVKLISYGESCINKYSNSRITYADSPDTSCDVGICSNKGYCVEVFPWRRCDCNRGSFGPTCAFDNFDEIRKLRGIISKMIDIVTACELTTRGEYDQFTEALKLVASPIAFWDREMATRILVQTRKLIKHVADIPQTAIEDLFLVVENIIAGATQEFASRVSRPGRSPDPAESYLIIKQARDVLEDFLKNMALVVVSEPRNITRKAFGLMLLPMTNALKATNSSHTINLGMYDNMGNLNQHPVTINNDLIPSADETKEEKAIVIGYRSQFDPYQVFNKDYQIISKVTQVKIFSPDGKAYEIVSPPGTNQGIIVNFRLNDAYLDKFNEAKCGIWDSKQNQYTVSKYKAPKIPTDQETVVCQYDRAGEFALILEKGSTWPKIPWSNPDFPEYRFTLNVGTIAYSIVIVIFSILLFVCYNKQESLANYDFNESLSVHPLYSIFKVNSATIPRTIRAQLFFLTITMQLLIQAFIARGEKAGMIQLAAYGVVLSWPTNYFFGVLARFLTGGLKAESGGKLVFMGLSQCTMVLAFAGANYLLGMTDTASTSRQTFMISHALGVAVDVFIIDTLVTVLANIKQVQMIVQFRGFYSSLKTLTSEHTAYIQQSE